MHKFAATLLAVALAALPAQAAPALGGLSTAGDVWKNQVALPSGSTVYAGDVIETGPEALAVLASPATGRIEIRAQSKAAIESSAIELLDGAVATAHKPVRFGDLEASPEDASAESWFVVAERDGQRYIEAHRGNVVIRGVDGAFTVPEGSYALAAAAPAPRRTPQDDQQKESDEDTRKATAKRGRAAGAGAKSGWKLGPLGKAGTIAVIGGGVTAASLGAAGAFSSSSASVQ